MDMRLRHPCNILISGASGSGKTNIVSNILRYKDVIFSENIDYVMLFYKEMQDVYQSLNAKNVINYMQSKAPNDIDALKILLSRLPKKSKKLLIFDDMMHDIDETFSEIFTVIGHHHNATIIFTTQSLFHGHKDFRTMSLNAHYIFLCKSPRNSSQIIQLAKQVYPYDNKILVDAFFDATREPYSYLLLDLHQSTPEPLRVRAKFFEHEWPMVVYQKQ